MAANDRPAEIQWLISNTTGEITGYMVGSTEYPPPPWSKDGTSMVSPPGGLSVPMVQTNVLTGATEIVGPGGVIVRPVISYAWANRPAAADSLGVTIRITDVGVGVGTLFISNGTYWVPAGRCLLANSAVSVSVPAVTTESVLATISIPAYLMGSYGRLSIRLSGQSTNSSNQKTYRIRFGGVSGTALAEIYITTSGNYRNIIDIQNRGVTNSQVASNQQYSAYIGSSGNDLASSSVDTTADTTLVITGQKALASESLSIEMLSVELINA